MKIVPVMKKNIDCNFKLSMKNYSFFFYLIRLSYIFHTASLDTGEDLQVSTDRAAYLVIRWWIEKPSR